MDNTAAGQGSPPRMRGLLYPSDMPQSQQGITPAHAGLTLAMNIAAGLIGDHPRACGAYRSALPAARTAMGSPPRMRGLPWAV